MRPTISSAGALLWSCAGLLSCARGEVPSGDFGLTSASVSAGSRDTEGETGRDEADTDRGETGSDPGARCSDGVENDAETDIDCGGPYCNPCGEGESCAADTDCETGSCVGNVCVQASCTDGVKNGDETDVDCGGSSCDACADNQGCIDGADCQSGVCTGVFCAAPSCGDGVQNGSETDVDCGGSCGGCGEGLACDGDEDCLSQHCPAGSCAPADCLDDSDCAAFSGPCTVGVCSAEKTCSAVATNDGNPCDDGDLCTTGDTCAAGSCSSGAAVDCSHLSSTCQTGVCNAANGACTTQSANEGNPCNDGNPCTVAEVCTAGQCQDPNAPGYLFHDPFANNSAGWTLGPNWQIGPTTTSSCAVCPGNDPATDHTPTADNGVAGVVIGGCTPTSTHADYCLTSPAVNTTGLGSVWLTYWRHLHADFSPYMMSTVQVFNGASWATIWSTANVCVNDVAWTQMGHNVSAYSNANFRVRFCYSIGSSGVFSSGGWSVDDVTIGPAQCTP